MTSGWSLLSPEWLAWVIEVAACAMCAGYAHLGLPAHSLWALAIAAVMGLHIVGVI